MLNTKDSDPKRVAVKIADLIAFSDGNGSDEHSIDQSKHKRPTQNTSVSINTMLDVIDLFIDSGQIDAAEVSLERYSSSFALDADPAQLDRLCALWARIPTLRKLEKSAGGPGSLFNSDHPFVKKCEEGIAEAREIMSFNRGLSALVS